jgi:hypothetical protein
MAKFKRFVLGSMLGAGMAFLLSRKEVRKALMGAGRKALPPAGSGDLGNEYSAAPSAESAISDEAGFEARIAETRQQVTEHIDSFTGSQPAAVTLPAEEAEPEEAAEPEAVAVEEPEAVEAEVVTVEEPQAAEPEVVAVEEPEAVEAEVVAVEEPQAIEAEVAEAPAEAEPVMEAAPVEAEIEAEIEAAPVEPETEAIPEPPAAKPTLEAELTVSGETGAPGPSAPSPSGIDRDEMRRRIDETRARLKAKAFDAMMSGETFIDETSAEKEAGHKEESPAFDEEIERSIDESLREQD